jgi:autotransporter-associated beta strand protein
MTVSTTGSLSGTSSVTVANGATFNVNGNGTLNSSAALTVNGTAAFTRASQTVASLSDSGAGTRSLSLTGTAFNVTNASSFSGNISGTGSLVKNTSGTLTLSGSNNSYSGTTTVSAGTLKIDGTVASAAGAFTIGNGSPSTGTLEGTNGNIHRTVSLNNGGTVSPGGNAASSAILADNLNLSGGSTYIVNITDSLNPATSAGIGYDTLTVANTLAINATGVGSDKITITVLAGAVNHWNPVKGNQFFTIATSNALTSFNDSKFVLDVSNFQQHNQTYPNYSWQVQQAGNDIRIAYVPEPGSAMLLGGAAIALLSGRRRRTA